MQQHYEIMREIVGDLNGLLLKELDVSVARWINPVASPVFNRCNDLLGLADDENLVHIRILSDNDDDIALRMFAYYGETFLRYKKHPRQILLYIGRDPFRMPTELKTQSMTFRYRAVDIRDLDGERLVASANMNDNVAAILARMGGHEQTVESITKKLGALEPAQRDTAFARLFIISRLRGMNELVWRDLGKMVDMTAFVMNSKVLDPEFKRNYKEGLQEGIVAVLRPLIEARFGRLPDWASVRLMMLSEDELIEVALRLLSANDLSETLRSGPAFRTME